MVKNDDFELPEVHSHAGSHGGEPDDHLCPNEPLAHAAVFKDIKIPESLIVELYALNT